MIYINKNLLSTFFVIFLSIKNILVYGQLQYNNGFRNNFYQGPSIKYVMYGNHQLPQTPIQYAGHQILQQQQQQFYPPQGGAMVMPQRPMQMVPGITPALDFHQVLLGGTRGYPGMRIRVNSRGFQYASSIIGNLLNDEIKKARIPPISQCMKEVSGCIQIYNIYVSRYRCPQRILLYPAPPNRIVISVQNLDIGITGNLGGQIIVLLPIRLSGIVQMNAHQVSITTELVIERSVTGSPFIRVASCNVQLGYVDAYLENAGIIGDIVNSQFRQRVSSQVRQMIPSKLCGQLPQIVNEKLNGKLTGLPQSISLLQIKDTIIGMMSAKPAYCSSPTCQGIKNVAINQEIVPLPSQSAPYNMPFKQSALVPSSATVSIPKPQYPQKTVHAATSRLVNNGLPQKLVPRSSGSLVNGVPLNRRVYPVMEKQIIQASYHPRLTRDVNFNINSDSLYQLVKKSKLFGAVTSIMSNNPCAGCPGMNEVEDPLTQARKLIDYLDWNKVSNIDLTLQLLNTYATTNDFTIDINGEFSPGGQGTTPFGPFPLQFPYPISNRMVDGIISDFTLNSLLYHAHRAGFFSVRIGPETPKVGNLLKTTCSDEEDELEDHGVETDEAGTFRMKMKGVRTHIINNFFNNNRKKRADDSGLEDLGICFGDILPAVREKYPNKLLAVNIHTTKAPAIILSAMNGGTIQGYLDADADIFIDGTTPPQRVGTISISAVVVATLSSVGDKVYGTLNITSLSLKDKDGTFGLPQDALDNLGNLGKELLEKAGNDILGKGLKVSIPSNTGLPIDISSPQIQIVEHGLYLAADFTVNPVTIQSLAGMSGHSGSCVRYAF